ncbi:hypothetical protein HELRODRAFT_165839 [Helobdella robusta]|uniref:C2 domain-containing protein n=1 Tax=Helobdella robusta TaxID=6412 RepID=T1EXC6_HELRO|nr:hypothetical protein HELRODRAFT_165839 [Helobdella robusta]ESN91768.1 hypothetical protein HELRODRAFT_165839 [Helobdella robusta]
MAGFVRVKLLNLEGNQLSTNNTYIEIRIKEAKENVDGNLSFIQNRRTLRLEWNAFFDSHLYDRRLVHIGILSNSSKQQVAEVMIGVHILSNYCHQFNDWNTVTLDLNPTGKIHMLVRHFKNEQDSTVLASKEDSRVDQKLSLHFNLLNLVTI